MHMNPVAFGAEGDGSPQNRYCPRCGAQLASQERGGLLRPTCPVCGFVHYRNPAPGVVVMLVQEGSVLLGKRSGGFATGKWGLPQGYVETGEDYLSAAVREVREETGLDARIRSIINVVSNLIPAGHHTLAIVLLAEVIGGELRPGDDLSDLLWVPLGEPLPEMAFSADRMIIEKCLREGLDWGLPVSAKGSEQVFRS